MQRIKLYVNTFIQYKSRFPTAIVLSLFTFQAACTNEALLPILDSGLAASSQQLEGGFGSFRWLDNDRLILISNGKANEILSVDDLRKNGLVEWSITQNKIKTLVDYNKRTYSAGLCVGDTQIKFYTTDYKTSSEYVIKLSPDKNIGEVLPNPKPTPFRTYNMFSDCEPVNARYQLPLWTKQYDARYNFELLRPEHGFIYINRDINKRDYSMPANWPKGLKFYLPTESQQGGVDLPIITKGKVSPMGKDGSRAFSFGEYRYYPFKQAYFVPFKPEEVGFYWIYPNGKIEQMPNTYLKTFNELSHLTFTNILMTKQGMVAMVSAFDDHLSILMKGRKGIIKLEPDGTYYYLVRGGNVASHAQVSPDGCKLAFLRGGDERERHPKPQTLQVINLCKGEQ